MRGAVYQREGGPCLTSLMTGNLSLRSILVSTCTRSMLNTITLLYSNIMRLNVYLKNTLLIPAITRYLI